MRSLAYALLKYDGANPAKADHAADRAGKRARDLAKQIRPEWEEGKADTAATTSGFTMVASMNGCFATGGSAWGSPTWTASGTPTRSTRSPSG